MLINYCVNDRPLYMFMALNSFKMLRQFNPTIPVKLFFIKSEANPTSEMGCFISEEDFLRQCDELSVEVIEKPWRPIVGEESYFPINKTYLSQLEEEKVLFIDVDTFIFGDVAKIFEKYNDVDFVACRNCWAEGENGWSSDLLTKSRIVPPFNSGIMLFNTGWHMKQFEEWGRLVREIKEGDSPLANWLRTNDHVWNREEMAISAMVAQSDISYDYFEKSDCYNILWPSDLETLDQSLISHTYTDNWKRAYNIVRGNVTRKKLKPKFLKTKSKAG